MAVESQGSMVDRRSSARSPLFMLVQTGDGKGAMWAWDISLGGMQCRPDKMRATGSHLRLMFRLPNGRQVFEVVAKVVGLRESQDGNANLRLQFCNPSATLQMAIHTYLHECDASLADPASAQAQFCDEYVVSRQAFDGLLVEVLSALKSQRQNRPTDDILPSNQHFSSDGAALSCQP